MRLFNSLQLVGAYVAWPFLLSWFARAEFPGHMAAFYSGAGLYIIATGAMTYAVYHTIGKD